MGFSRYFSMLDSFGVGINFYLKGYNNRYNDYRSILGGFVTIIIYVVTITCGVIFSKELFQKINPTVSTSTMNNPNPQKILYPNKTFFMLGLTIDFIPFVDERIYRIAGFMTTKINGSETLLRQNLSVEICDKVLNKEYVYFDVIKHLNLSNFYCISLNQSEYNVDINNIICI